MYKKISTILILSLSILSTCFAMEKAPVYLGSVKIEVDADIEASRLSTDGTTFAIEFSDYTLQLYNIETSKPKWKTKKQNIRYSDNYDFSPPSKLGTNSNTFAMRFRDKTLQLYDTKTGQPKWRTRKQNIRYGSYKFSPCGTTFAIEFSDHTLQLYDIKTGQPKWKTKKENVYSCEFDPDGKTLAIEFSDHTLQLYDIETSKPKWETKNIIQNFHYYTFSPEGSTLAVRYSNYTLQLYDIETNLPKWKTKKKNVYSCKFNPNGKTLAVLFGTFKNSTLQLYDIETGRPKWENKIQNIYHCNCKFCKNPTMDVKLVIATFSKETQEFELHTYLFPDEKPLMSQEDSKERIGFLKEEPKAKEEVFIQMVNSDGTTNSKPITMWKLLLFQE